MDERTEHPDTARTVSPALCVTLVSGLHADDRSRVCRQLAGSPAGSSPSSEISDETDDSGDFALVLADELLAAARGGATGQSVVGLDPETDVMEVGFILETALESRREDGPVVELHDMIAVVSVSDVHRWLLSPAPAPAIDYVTAERLASQIEFATVILLTDTASVRPEELSSVLGLLERLNSDAVVATAAPTGSAHTRAASGRGCARRLGQRMGWTRALANPDIPATFRHKVGVLVFRDPRPFHPERLFDAVRHELVPHRVGRIARSRGLVQLASRASHYGSWRSAGDTVSFDPTGMSSWDTDAPVGQEIVFFGEHLRRDRVIAALHACLLTDEELLAAPAEWARYSDPFPSWPNQHNH